MPSRVLPASKWTYATMIGKTQPHCTITLIILYYEAVVCCLNLSFGIRNHPHHGAVSNRDILRPKISQLAHFAGIAGHKPSSHGTSSEVGLCPCHVRGVVQFLLRGANRRSSSSRKSVIARVMLSERACSTSSRSFATIASQSMLNKVGISRWLHVNVPGG